ncbi:lysozyme [Microvirga sp. W0021]|uniref:Lysozyme n=1 Tax=Hohaiivirga grylli TaxID=3133970 RepID=A0ABV0BLD9_9HYPH
MQKINIDGLKLIKQWEGLRTTAYKDVVGILTIGYGHTSSAGAPVVSSGMKITETEAEEILKRDLEKFEKRVTELVKVPLTDNQFAVLVSFDFNTGALHKSTLLKKLNAGDYASVPAELMKWINAGGKKVKGLVNRRAAECGLWVKGEFVASNYIEASSEQQSVTHSPEGQAAAVASVGALGTVFTEAANQISPYVESLPSIRYVFIGLTLIGVALGFYATFRRLKGLSAC